MLKYEVLNMNYEIQFFETSAIISHFRNFPSITLKIKEQSKKDYSIPDYKYIAEPNYSFWAPDIPSCPCRKTGHGKTREEAVVNAFNATFCHESDNYSDEQVFITCEKEKFEEAYFIDGKGISHPFNYALRIISENNPSNNNS